MVEVCSNPIVRNTTNYFSTLIYFSHCTALSRNKKLKLQPCCHVYITVSYNIAGLRVAHRVSYYAHIHSECRFTNSSEGRQILSAPMWEEKWHLKRLLYLMHIEHSVDTDLTLCDLKGGRGQIKQKKKTVPQKVTIAKIPRAKKKYVTRVCGLATFGELIFASWTLPALLALLFA